MKKFTSALICFAFYFTVNAQKVPSSCIPADGVKALYSRDAYQIALNYIFAKNLDHKYEAVIHKSTVDTFLNALIAVHNATSLKARDTVISYLNVHTSPRPDMQRLKVGANRSLDWMIKLRDNIIPTGDYQVDQLLSTYQLKPEFYFPYGATHAYIYLISDSNYNIEAIANSFALLSGVTDAHPRKWVGDGSNIVGATAKDVVFLTYSYGCGDCESGCLVRRNYDFKVYLTDCSVEYVGSQGDVLTCDPLSINEEFIPKTIIAPSPFKDKIDINITGSFNYNLANSLGQTMAFGVSQNSSIGGLQNLPPGIYFLYITLGNTTTYHKLIKE